MTKITLFTFLSLAALGCLNVNAQTTPQVKFTEITFGPATSTTILKEEMANSPSGDHSVVANQVFIKKTSRIEAKKGIQFGVEYKLTSTQNDTARLDIEWVFPVAITDPDKKTSFKSVRYPIEMPLNSINASIYGLDNDFEVVKGTWQLNIYYADKMIYTHKFELY